MIPNLKENYMIKINLNHSKEKKENLWRGYNVNICKDVESANEELKKILKNRKENLK